MKKYLFLYFLKNTPKNTQENSSKITQSDPLDACIPSIFLSQLIQNQKSPLPSGIGIIKFAKIPYFGNFLNFLILLHHSRLARDFSRLKNRHFWEFQDLGIWLFWETKADLKVGGVVEIFHIFDFVCLGRGKSENCILYETRKFENHKTEIFKNPFGNLLEIAFRARKHHFSAPAAG